MNLATEVVSSQDSHWNDPRFDTAAELSKDHNFSSAIEVYDEILRSHPGHPRALHASGFLLHQLGQSGEAVARIKKALSLKPDYAGAYNNLGTIFLQTGQLPEAMSNYQKAIELQPNCLQFYSNFLFCLECDPSASAETRYKEAVKASALFFPTASTPKDFPNLADPDKPIRIGLVSPDLGIHPVGFFLLPLLEYNDREKYLFICYSTSDRFDSVSRVLQENSLTWRNVSQMSDGQVEELIRLDRIDVLIDLSGHTGQNRLSLFAQRAAPVQATWLGYSFTTAVPAIDYFFADDAAIAPGEENNFTEKIIRLSPSRFCYVPVGEVPEVSAPPIQNNGFCTFGSFNSLAKLNDEVVRVWSQILNTVPQARLVLKNRLLCDQWLQQRFWELFRQYGVEPERIEFRPFSPHAEMMAEYNDIDIALDPFPYSGGMTSCNALWMGVPVVAMVGDRPIGRQTSGFSNLLELEELVCSNAEEYIACAVQLAADPDRLSSLRKGLRDRFASSPLSDPTGFAHGFESALRKIWHDWCQMRPSTESSYPWDDVRFDLAYGAFIKAREQGKQPEEAYEIYLRLLTEFPDHPRALHALGVVLHNMGDSNDGIAYIRRSILLKPDYADAYNNLGNVYVDLRRFAEATECFRQFVQFRPDNHVAHKNLARALLELGQRKEALQKCWKALELSPGYAEAMLTVGNILMASGEAAKAYEFTARAVKLAPRDSALHSNLLYTMNFLAAVTQEEIYRESLRWSRRHADSKRIHGRHLNVPIADKKLRVGYVSGDFKLHPVSYHLKPVIEHHDRSQFEIYLYSTFDKTDEMSELLISHAEHWRMVASLSDQRLEEMIRVDGIDILVDLSGHTAFNRLGLFALKPAPVQVSWIGYFNTTGLKAMDYLISDPVTLPEGEERWVSEEVIRLPDGRFCYSPPSDLPAVSESPFLRNGLITFGAFNRLAKVTPETVELWSAVLNEVAGSRLVIKTYALSEPTVADTVLAAFKAHGIAAERLELRDDSPYQQMLEEYGDVDISLDTFPFNGGATTCEALWMGVPVITLTGHTPISRQSASLLASCGLSNLIAESTGQFVAIARQLSTDISGLKRLRQEMRGKLHAAPISNGRLFTSNLEDAYRHMWRSWCERQKVPKKIPFNNKVCYEEYLNAALDRLDAADDSTAVQLLKYALKKQPHSAVALKNLGIALLNQGTGHLRAAIRHLRKAVTIDPLLGDAYKHLGRALDQTKQTRLCQEAAAAFATAVKLLPHDAEAHYWRANFMLSLGHASEALAIFREAVTLAPDNAEINANLIFTMNYLSECSQDEILAEAIRWDACHGWHGAKPDFSDHPQNEKLRIGYLSADFHRHPVGIFFQAVAVNHDRDFCAIYCYNNRRNPRQDEVYGVIRSNVEVWRDVRDLSDEELQALIVADKIDLLVDLSGYTDGNRLRLFSRRAAPVQVSWLGYYNTTGVAAMDYVVSDEATIPPGSERWYSEKVIRMPVSRFCYTPAYICPDVEPLAAHRKRYVTFGSFNNYSKLTEQVVEAWSMILRRVPGSRVVLKWKNFCDQGIKQHYRLLFSLHGISSKRLEFRDASPPFAMQDEYNDIDIALDPFPFSGGLTSCEALWMGVPVVTYAGDRPVSRQTAGFLKAIGLERLVAETVEQYVDTAVGLAGDLQALATLRSGLRQRMANSPLCDGPAFTAALEERFRIMWHEWEKKQDSVDVYHGEK